MKVNFLVTILILSLLVCSCLEEIQVNIEPDNPQLVVQGFVNDLAESYQVKLNTLKEVNGAGTNTLGANAEVSIVEINGDTILLTETIPGTYVSQPGVLVGEIGKSYQLLIELANGESYQSSVETIPEPVELGDGFVVENTRFSERYRLDLTLGHDVFIEVEMSEKPQYFLMEATGWARVQISAESCVDGVDPGPAFCWSKRDPIKSNELIIGTSIDHASDFTLKAVSNIGVDTKTEYVAIIRTNSMSQEAYGFFQKIKDQLDRPGGIFDRPLAPIIGNIVGINTSNSALGYFHAYAINEKAVCYDRFDAVVFASSPPAVPCGTLCTEVFAPATFDDVYEQYCVD